MARTKGIKVNKDIEDIADAGFDKYLHRMSYRPPISMEDTNTYRKSGMSIGGVSSQDNSISLGRGNVQIDSEKGRILIHNGANPLILIGMDKGGF